MNIKTTLKDNSIKYIPQEQFSLSVYDKDYLIIQKNKYNLCLLYQNKTINQESITEPLVPGVFLSKYKSIYYTSFFISDNMVISASFFKKYSNNNVVYYLGVTLVHQQNLLDFLHFFVFNKFIHCCCVISDIYFYVQITRSIVIHAFFFSEL